MDLKGIFSRKNNNERDQRTYPENNTEADETSQQKNESESIIEEVPEDKCRQCYESFKSGDEAYKCENCDTVYHYPNCIRNQTSCRVCGEKIIEKNHVVKLVNIKYARCPKCKIKMQLDYSLEYTE